MEKEQIRVIIVDDHPVVLQGFEYMLQDVDGIAFAGKFTDAAVAIGYLRHNPADIVLLDISLPGINGIDASAEIRKLNPDIRIIAISNINEYSIIRRMMDSGANGYLLKNSSADEVIMGIRNAASGGMAFSKGIQDIIDGHKSGDLPVVTRREKEILALLAEGLSSVEIGEKVFISAFTVESHRRNLLQKFKVTNVAALVHKATEMKYI